MPSWKFERHSRMSLRGGRPFRMSGSCREALPNVREDLPVVREWSRDPSECPGGPPRFPVVVGMFSLMSGSVWEAVPDVQECSGGHTRCLGVVGRPYRMSGSGRVAHSDVQEAHPNVQDWSGGPCDIRESSGGPHGCPGGPPECPGVVGRPFRNFGRPLRISRSGRLALLYVRECLEGSSGSLGGPPGCPGVVEKPSRMSL